VTDYSELGYLGNVRVFEHRAGKAVSADGLAKLANVKALHLLAVEQLHSIYAINNLREIEWLKVSRCPELTDFPEFSKLSRLRRVVLEKQGGCGKLSAFADAPALDDLIILESKQLSPSDFKPLAEPERPKRVLPGIGKMNSADFAEVCRILKGKVTTSYYGSPSEFFELEYGAPEQKFLVKLS
jgi:hypothetical protein